MARKSVDLTFLRGKEVDGISDDDDGDDDDDDYDDEYDDDKFYQKNDSDDDDSDDNDDDDDGDDDDDDDGDDDTEETLGKYSKPVSVYKIFAERSKNRPLYLRRCLKYIIRAKKNKTSNTGGKIVFNYMDRRKIILKVEVVKKFSCPFCLMLCGSQWGLRDHLETTHDVFNFAFWEKVVDHPEVDVTLKYDENSSGEEQEKYFKDHNKIPYYFCSKRRRKRSRRVGRNKMKRLNVRFLDLDLNELPSDTENESTHVNDDNVSSPPRAHSPEETREIPTTTPPLPAIAQSPEPVPAIAQSSEPLPAIAQSSEPLPVIAQSCQPKVPRASKRKKLLAERVKAKRQDPLKSRQFYHSQTKQPMTFEEVMSKEDSENEEDDYSADIKERMRLLQIVDASKEEKHFMHLWNIFIRKKRVIADRYVPRACEEFTKLHKEELMSSTCLSSTSFFWWWRLFKIKLWKHGLICANTIDKCSIILRNSDEAGPSTFYRTANANTEQWMEVDVQ